MNKILTKISFIIFIIPMIVLVNNFNVANAEETSENNVNAVHIIDPNDNKVITDYGHRYVPVMTWFVPMNDKNYTTNRQVIYHDY